LNSCCACGEGKCTRAHRALVGKSRQASTGDCDWDCQYHQTRV